ncbi:MAG: flagellar hook-length control protein FliK [Desulfatirhabdiaceae bacterium]
MIQENSFLSTKINPKGQFDSMGKTLSNRSQNDDEFNNSVADWLKQFSDVLSRIERDPGDGKKCSDETVPNEAPQDSHWPKQKKKTEPDSLELINPQTIWPLNAAPVSDMSLIDRIAITRGDMDTVITDGFQIMEYPVGISEKLSGKSGRMQHPLSLLADLIQDEGPDNIMVQNKTPFIDAPTIQKSESSGLNPGLQAITQPESLSGRLPEKNSRTFQQASLSADFIQDEGDNGIMVQTKPATTASDFQNSQNGQTLLHQTFQEKSSELSELKFKGTNPENSETESGGANVVKEYNPAQNRNMPNLENTDDFIQEVKFSDHVTQTRDANSEIKITNTTSSIPENRNSVSKQLELPVIRQIVDHASIKLIDGHSQIRIELKPESLGNLTLQISSENNQISLKITAENFQVKDVIENQIGQLRVELQRKGMEIDTVHVDIFNPESTYSQSGRQGHAETQQDKNGTSFAYINDEDEPETTELSDTNPPVPVLPSDRKLSCFA